MKSARYYTISLLLTACGANSSGNEAKGTVNQSDVCAQAAPAAAGIVALDANTLSGQWQEITPNGLMLTGGSSFPYSVRFLGYANGNVYAVVSGNIQDPNVGSSSIYRSDDAGNTWAGLPVTSPRQYAGGNYYTYALVSSPANANELYSYDSEGNVITLALAQCGAAAAIASQPLYELTAGGTFDLAPRWVDPSSNALLSTSYAGIYLSSDNGVQWSVVYNANSQGGYGPIVPDPKDANVLWAGLSFQILKSLDSGLHWDTPVSVGNQNALISDIIFDTNHTMYVAKQDGVFASSDGNTFTNVLVANGYSAVAHVADASGDLIFATYTTPSTQTYSPSLTIAQTSDGGSTWSNALGGATIPTAFAASNPQMVVDGSQNLFISLGISAPILKRAPVLGP